MALKKENTANENMVLVARVTAAHGIKGLVKVQSFTATPSDFVNYAPLFDDNGNTVEIKVSGEAKGQFLVQLAGVTTRNDAEVCKGMNIYANRDNLGDLEDGEFFMNDLIDMDIADVDGNVYGTVNKVLNYGSCDLLEVKSNQGKTFLVPVIEEKVEMIDFENNQVIVNDIAELLALGGIKDNV